MSNPAVAPGERQLGTISTLAVSSTPLPIEFLLLQKKKIEKKKNGERVKERERERGTRKGRGENPLLRLAKSVVRVLTMSGEDWHHLLDIHCRSAGRGCSSFLLGFNAIAIKVNWSIDQQIRCSFYDLTIEIKQSFSLGLFSFNCIFF